MYIRYSEHMQHRNACETVPMLHAIAQDIPFTRLADFNGNEAALLLDSVDAVFPLFGLEEGVMPDWTAAVTHQLALASCQATSDLAPSAGTRRG